MIAYLQGTVFQKGTNFLIVNTGSVGYKIFVTPELLEKSVGDKVEVYTYLKTTEDEQTLYGLSDFATLQFFELLITVTGVGPKVALGIVSAAGINTLQQAIVNEDAAIFTRMSGVGKKTADRIILELKSKVAGGVLTSSGVSGSDVFDALIALGYNPREVREVIPKIDSTLSTDKQLKQALKFLGK